MDRITMPATASPGASASIWMAPSHCSITFLMSIPASPQFCRGLKASGNQRLSAGEILEKSPIPATEEVLKELIVRFFIY
jgi:hypothetical protein